MYYRYLWRTFRVIGPTLISPAMRVIKWIGMKGERKERRKIAEQKQIGKENEKVNEVRTTGKK